MGDGMPDVTITSLGLENTLLFDAIIKGKARFVSDCATYLQVGVVLRSQHLTWLRDQVRC